MALLRSTQPFDAWGWSVVSTLALYAAIAALIGFIIMLGATIGDFVADPRIASHHLVPDES